MVECHHVCDDGLLIRVLCEHIYKKEKSARISPAAIKDASAAPAFFLFLKMNFQNQSVVRPLAFRIQEFCHTQLLLCHVKGVLKVVSGVGLFQSVIIHKIRPEIDRGDGGGGRFNKK